MKHARVLSRKTTHLFPCVSPRAAPCTSPGKCSVVCFLLAVLSIHLHQTSTLTQTTWRLHPWKSRRQSLEAASPPPSASTEAPVDLALHDRSSPANRQHVHVEVATHISQSGCRDPCSTTHQESSLHLKRVLHKCNPSAKFRSASIQKGAAHHQQSAKEERYVDFKAKAYYRQNPRLFWRCSKARGELMGQGGHQLITRCSVAWDAYNCQTILPRHVVSTVALIPCLGMCKS